jgi:hypothetical protein
MFQLGKVVATPGALELLERTRTNPLDYIQRHESGDWGKLCPEDKQANNAALKQGLRLLSAYEVGREMLWIITEADRSVTTLLLPEEY